MSETPDDNTAFDAKQFRTVLGHFPTGVTIVSGLHDSTPVGFTIGSFTSVSLDPPLVGFLPMKDSETWAAMADERFVLRQHTQPTAGRPVLEVRQERQRGGPIRRCRLARGARRVRRSSTGRSPGSTAPSKTSSRWVTTYFVLGPCRRTRSRRRPRRRGALSRSCSSRAPWAASPPKVELDRTPRMRRGARGVSRQTGQMTRIAVSAPPSDSTSSRSSSSSRSDVATTTRAARSTAVLETAIPFLGGLAIAWWVTKAWRRPIQHRDRAADLADHRARRDGPAARRVRRRHCDIVRRRGDDLPRCLPGRLARRVAGVRAAPTDPTQPDRSRGQSSGALRFR